MPKPIQDPTVGQLLQRAFGLVGRVRPALDEVIIPVVNVADLAKGSEVPLTRRASASFGEAAGGAGVHIVARLEVPPNIIAVVERIIARTTGFANLLAHFGSILPAPANVATKSFTDGRLIARGEQPAAVLTSGQDPTPALTTWDWRAVCSNLAEQQLVLNDVGWVVGDGRPGQFGFLEFGLAETNVGLQMAIEWTEYQLT